MVRTQIYLTEREQSELRLRAKQTGKTQSELIRLAIDRLLFEPVEVDRRALLVRGKGLWKGREDLPEPDELRREWERSEA